MSNKPPIEVPQGAIRLNTDSQKLEFYAQDRWYEMATEESTPIGNRGVYAGDQEPGSNDISYFSLTTGGTGLDFGNLNFTSVLASAVSSRTRGIFTHSWGPGNSQENALDFITIATAGNATDFGDRTIGTFNGTGSSNQTRGIFAGGHVPGLVNNVDFVTIASTGNATDFGDTLAAIYSQRSCSNPTRMVMGGGAAPGSTNVVQYVTIASTGDFKDFGDLTSARSNLISCGNATRGFWIGGGSGPTNTIDFLTTTTLGNAQDFGDTVNTFLYAGDGATASQTRGFYIDGGAPGTPEGVTDISQFNMIHKGNAFAFGDLNYAAATGGFVSNCHGGL